MKAFFIGIVLILSFIPQQIFSHSFDPETIGYILWTPDSSWSDFKTFLEESNKDSLLFDMRDPELEVAIALELPGKLYVWNYITANPNFDQKDIEDLISEDPLLSEIWASRIYNYIQKVLSEPNLPEFVLNENVESDASINSEFINLNSFESFYKSVVIWFQHILFWYDHILFLFTLVVCLPAWKRILQVITTFTVAHCITIILWGLQIITLPSLLVESMIVWSIVIMGIYAYFRKIWEEKNLSLELWVIFILGLFHGLGFAGFFSEVLQMSENIIIPVLWFNIWVELGQILIMSCILLSLSLIYKSLPKHTGILKNILAIISVVLGTYWLIIKFI